MYRASSFLLVLMLSSSLLFSAGRNRTYTERDELYIRTNLLSQSADVLGISPVSPVTGEALVKVLERIDRERLTEAEKAEYDYILSELEGTSAFFSYGGMAVDGTIMMNLRQNVAGYGDFDYSNRSLVGRTRKDETLIPYRYETPFVSGNLGITFVSFIYIECGLSIGNNNHHMAETSLGWLVNNYGGRALNLFMASGYRPLNSLSLDFPYRAGAAIGNEHVSFIFGRYPHSMGRGRTGNLLIGDNFTYQELALLSFMNRYFSYNISVTSFDREESVSQTATTIPVPSSLMREYNGSYISSMLTSLTE